MLRLCLWLIGFFSLQACKVFKDGTAKQDNSKTYRLTVIALPYEESTLISALAETGLSPELVSGLAYNAITGRPELFIIKVHLHSESEWKIVQSKLMGSGICQGKMSIELE
jgi:hypothetical protein